VTINTAITFRVATIRDITVKECSWLASDIPAGTLLELRSDPYGVCRNGIAVGFTGDEKYFEVPTDAVIGINEDATSAHA
jgi:hypothetical protein